MNQSAPDGASGSDAVTTPAQRPYQSLYRRYRPQRFAEVRGQDHVTRALRNSVRDDRITHAYLFSGPRGTGKTSTARILAKALNCATPVEGEPCGACDSCTSIVAGTSFDVHELDAASNNGVEAMRDLVARAALATPGRWKVYIVDEVHMLSTGASNALLKTLEEPPDHVVFVLATTDPQKVLPTIRSRTQHFEFHLLPEDVLEKLLGDVAADAGLDLPAGGLGVALRRGRGSARDALSVLDQVAASGTTEDDSDTLGAIVAGIAERDTAAVLTRLDETLRNGRDPQQVAVELIERLRAGFLALVAPDMTAAPGLTSAPVTEARLLGTARCVRSMELVGGAIVSMRDAPEPRITLEVALVRAAHPEADDSVESLLDRLVQLEHRVEALANVRGGPTGAPLNTAPSVTARDAMHSGLAPVSAVEPGATTGSIRTSRPVLGAYRNRTVALGGDPSNLGAGAGADTGGASGTAGGASTGTGDPDGSDSTNQGPSVAPPERPGPSGAVPPDRDALVAAWGDHVLAALRPKVRAYYQAGRFVGVDGDGAVFALPNAVHVSQAEPLRQEVVTALTTYFGRSIALRLVVEGSWSSTVSPASENSAIGSAATRPTPEPDAPSDGEHASESSDEAAEIGSLDDVSDLTPAAAPSGLTWAEGRLLQAFPGAEEV